MALRWQKGSKSWMALLIFPAGGNTASAASGRTPSKKLANISKGPRRRSTGVSGKGDEPIGDALGELVKGFAFSAGVAADLALIEDQGQGIGQKPDHGQHHQGRGLVDC